MPRTKQICLCFLMSIGVQARGFSQDTLNILYYPSAKEFTETVHASARLSGDSLAYAYTVENSINSLQSVYLFDVSISSTVKSTGTPKEWGVRVGEGILAIPRVMWSSSDSINNIAPGTTLGGFTFSSKGLPSIKSYYAMAFVLPPVVEVEPDSIVGGGGFLKRSKIGRTLAPTDPPNPFIPLAFLDTLISYKHQAFALGWIKNQGIANSLNQKLENARRQLERGNKTPARNMLRAFVNEVEALNKQGKQLTSEAYALLKFNAEYLIGKL